MSVTTTLAACSQTVSANGPDGTVDAPSTLDDAIRYALSFVAQLRDTKAAIGANSDITALSALASINGGPIAGTRSRVMNGNFAINQRAVTGTVTLAAGVYGHDRWKAGAGGCTYTFAASGADTVLTISAGSLMQVVEGVNIEGGVYTVSQTGTAQARIAVTGAVTSGAYAALPLASASATGGQTVTVEFITGTVSLVQMESGTKATTFERRSYGLELALCQRYYRPANLKGSQYSTTGAVVYQDINSMRATPTIAIASYTSEGFGAFGAASFSTSGTTTDLARGAITMAAFGVVGAPVLAIGSLSAEL